MSDSLRRARRRRRYAEVPEALLFNPKISSHAKTAWGILDRHIDNRTESLGTETEGVAFPSRATLAGYMGVSLDTVDRALAELRLAGWLSTTARGQGRTALNELHDEPDAAQARLQETARVRRQEAARVRSPKKNGPKDNDQKGTNPPTPRKRGAQRKASSAASSSPRPSPLVDDLPGPTDSRLTPGPTPTPRPPSPAEQLARRLVAEVSPVLAKNVRVLKVDVAQLLENGFSPDEIDAAARHPECHSWTYNALAFHAKKARGRRHIPRTPPPDPEDAPVTATPGQIAAMLQSRNERRAKMGLPLLEVPA